MRLTFDKNTIYNYGVPIIWYEGTGYIVRVLTQESKDVSSVKGYTYFHPLSAEVRQRLVRWYSK